MGNKCTSFGQHGVRPSQRYAAMEKYSLSEDQLNRIEDLFKRRAANKRFLTLKDFRSLYSNSRFDHDDEDIEVMFKTLAEPPGENSSAQQRSDGGRITFDGFVRLTMLCNYVTAAESSGTRKDGGSKDVPDSSGGKTEDSNGGYGDQNGNGGSHSNKNSGGSVDTDMIRVLFNVMDSDGSGTISESEFHRFVLNFVDDETTSQGIFGKLDQDRSRAIDFDEFNGFCQRHKRILMSMCSYILPIV